MWTKDGVNLQQRNDAIALTVRLNQLEDSIILVGIFVGNITYRTPLKPIDRFSVLV
jgi:hypothetical protein